MLHCLPHFKINLRKPARPSVIKNFLIIELQQKQFVVSNFQGDDKQISFYTGFPDYATFKAVFMALQPTAENMVGWSQAQRLKHTSGEVIRQGFSASKLSTMDQFFLFLCRLRQGFPEQDLATRFHLVLNARSRLLDCTEIHVQKPSSKVLNSAIYSHYKGNTRFKDLIGIAPSGEVTFVSDLYIGSISDKEITKKSGILSVLEEGDMVMADKGFLIKDLLSERQVSLWTLHCRRSSKDSSDSKTANSCRARVIRRIKEYHIFDKVLPMTLVGSVNQLWAVCALLTNFESPLF
ncbi:hypothetical protein N1851_026918 [Merluccius polli]|uniref:DDE Tnp4 domain-containing protein n=1 Tax=Merluccius polli TaxID=89951 RepID=A0AA47NSL6_MERPO|nr:hypothetical protein N1851_026918 [Merluccius polli]